ncbi:MAG TPA: hypothetical protein VIZ29_11380 [Gaiellaceae bacterium]
MIEQRIERAAGRALRSLEPVTTRGYARAFHAPPARPTAPTVREFQRAQLEVALEWAEVELA